MLLANSADARVVSVYAPDALPTENAFFDSATGNGGAGNVVTWQDFKNNVESAAVHSLGGVINFESYDDLASTSLIRPSLGNDLGFEIHGSEFSVRNLDFYGDHSPIPSGSYVFCSSYGSTLGNEFRFTSFDFTSSDILMLNQVGFTLIGDRFDDIAQAEITATFSGGGSVTLDSNLRSGDDEDRIFYGFTAPEGESIISILSNFGGIRIVFLDDFGFIAAPEPGSVPSLTVSNAYSATAARAPAAPAMQVVDSYAGNSPVSVSAGDVDGDGDTDLVGTSYYDGLIMWWENVDATGSTWAEHQLDRDNEEGARIVLATDIRGMAQTDVVYAGRGSGEIRWYINEGGSGTSWVEEVVYDAWPGANGVDAEDIDGDGDIDLIGAAIGETEAIRWFENTGISTQWVDHVVTTISLDVASVVAGDIDGDGDADLLTAAYDEGEISWWENVGGLGTNWWPHLVHAGFALATTAVIEDMDGDGDADLLAAANGGGLVAWWENSAGDGGLWNMHILDRGLAEPFAVRAEDLDGDSDADVVLTTLGGGVSWYDNADGIGAVWRRQPIDGSRYHLWGLDIADFTGDGHLDVVVASPTDDNVVFWDLNLGQTADFPPGMTTKIFYPDTPSVLHSVSSEVLIGGSHRVVCTGWTRTGSDPGTGDGSATDVFNFTNDTTVVFHWADEYWLETEADGRGTVDPTDSWVLAGSNVTLTAEANDIATHFAGWTGDVPPSQTNDNPLVLLMDQPRTVTAHFITPQWDVVVSNAFETTFWKVGSTPVGSSLAPVWTNTFDGALNMSAYTSNGVVAVGEGSRWACTGWTRSGSDPASGGGTGTGPFALTNNATLAFLWQRQHWLEVYSEGPGVVDVENGWIAEGTNVTISATADGPIDEFVGWSGDVPVGQANDNPLVLSMDQARSVTAHFVTRQWDVIVHNAHAVSEVASQPSYVKHLINGSFSQTRWIDAADMDGDDDTDVVGVANYTFMAWWENADGAGTVWNGDRFVVFSGAQAAFAADVDGDGDMDLLGAGDAANEVAWWENALGDASSWIKHVIGVDFHGADSVCGEDMDRDGDIDALGAAYDDGAITWWENLDGSGTNWVERPVSLEFWSAFHVRAADVDGDGDMDVLGAALISAKDITWWENIDGYGVSWSEHVINGEFDGATSVHAADVDGDGDTDVLGAARYDNLMTWWENVDGSGRVWTEQTIDEAYDGANSAIGIDFDRDGDIDVLGAGIFADEVSWWENDGGQGTNWAKHVVGTEFDTAWAALPADIDGDGHLDIVASTGYDYETSWWENRVEVFSTFYPPLWTNRYEELTDLLVYSTSTVVQVDTGTRWWCRGWTRSGCEPDSGPGTKTSSFVLTNDTDITFHWDRQYRLDVETNGPGCVDVYDAWMTSGTNVTLTAIPNTIADQFTGWSGDVPPALTNSNPLVLTMDQPRSIMAHFVTPVWDVIVANDMSGSVAMTPLTYAQHVVGGSLPKARALDAGDIDGDGVPDVSCTVFDGDQVLWWRYEGGDQTWNPHTVVSGYDGASSVQALDFDQDGDADLLGAAYYADRVSWFENIGGEGTNWMEHLIEPSLDGAYMAQGGDLDGDGDPDVLVAANLADQVVWYEDVDGGSTNWVRHAIATGFDAAYGVYIVDLDGDGDLDALGAAYNSDDITWWENTSGDASAWVARAIDTSFDGAAFVETIDLDGDGDQDVLGAARVADDMAWWENADGTGHAWIKHMIDGSFNGANSVQAEDLDGDGDLDVLGAGWDGDEVAWWENLDGMGGGWQKHTVATGFDGAWSAVAEDFDGDAMLDIACTAYYGNQLAWWENESEVLVLFQPPVWTNSITATSSLSVQSTGSLFRLNSQTQWVCRTWTRAGSDPAEGPGTMCGPFPLTNDTAITFQWERQFWLDVGSTGRGSVDPPSRWAWEGSSMVVAIPDDIVQAFAGWTGDVPVSQTNENPLTLMMDRPRSITAHFITPQVQVVVRSDWEDSVLRSASARFTPHVIDEAFDYATGIDAADLDGDGWVDVLGAAYAGDEIAWWRNLDGTGTNWSKRLVASGYDGARTVVAVDLDDDGFLDILGAGSTATAVTWWRNTDGSGTNWAVHAISSEGVREFCVADVDSDGDMDIVPAPTASEVAWWENVASGATWVVHPIDFLSSGADEVATADVDADGDLDVLVSAYQSGPVLWFENRDGVGGAWARHTVTTGSAADLLAAHLDDDQYPDIVLDRFSRLPEFSYWRNGGGAGMTWSEVGVGPVQDPLDLHAADLDGDGDQDLLTSDYGNRRPRVDWWENVGGTGTNWVPHPLCEGGRIVGMQTADLNGDGAKDILVADDWGDAIRWYAADDTDLAWFHPTTWTSVVEASTSVAAYATSAVHTMGESSQWMCTGWTRVGSDAASGQGWNTGAFVLTNDTTVTFHWDLHLLLDTEAEGPGHLDVPDRWLPLGSETTVTATADTFFYLTGWSGDTQGCAVAGNQLVAVMDQARSVTARFAPNLATNEVPEWWLAGYGWTSNFNVYALLDPDGDRMLTWEEWNAGTNPTNGLSSLRLTDISCATNGRLALTFSSVPHRTYTLYATASLHPPSWEAVDTARDENAPLRSGPVVAGGETTTLHIEPVAGTAAYRLDVRRLLRITGVSPGANGKITLSFVGTPWDAYVVESSADGNTWTSVEGLGPILPETETGALNLEPNSDAAMYRITRE